MPRFIRSWTIVCFTDRAVAVFDSRWPVKPSSKRRAWFPRGEVRIGSLGSGYYSSLRLLLDPPLWVWRPFYGEVHAADATPG